MTKASRVKPSRSRKSTWHLPVNKSHNRSPCTTLDCNSMQFFRCNTSLQCFFSVEKSSCINTSHTMTKAASTRTNEKNVNEISTKAHFGLNLLHQMEKLQFSALLHKAQPLPLISESAQRFFFADGNLKSGSTIAALDLGRESEARRCHTQSLSQRKP
jgi:hypothetical protein